MLKPQALSYAINPMLRTEPAKRLAIASIKSGRNRGTINVYHSINIHINGSISKKEAELNALKLSQQIRTELERFYKDRMRLNYGL